MKQDLELLDSVVYKGVDISPHARAMFSYAAQCNHVTEFGTRYGDSGRVFLAAGIKSLVCYDLVDIAAGKALGELAKERGVEFHYLLKDTTRVVIEPTDLLFLDTIHTFEQVQSELRNASHVRKFLIFHDSNEQGVAQAIRDFLKENADWMNTLILEVGVGLTVLRRLRF